jgi:5-methylthioadenosine/S-adenosylhomocysteine deaminase
VLDGLIQRAKSDGVDLVMVAGEVVYDGGRFTRVDRHAALSELHQSSGIRQMSDPIHP